MQKSFLFCIPGLETPWPVMPYRIVTQKHVLLFRKSTPIKTLKNILFQKLFWPFTVWKKNLCFSRPLSLFFTFGQNNFQNKVPFFPARFWRDIYEPFIYNGSVKSWGNRRINIQKNKKYSLRNTFNPLLWMAAWPYLWKTLHFFSPFRIEQMLPGWTKLVYAWINLRQYSVRCTVVSLLAKGCQVFSIMRAPL